MLLIVNHKNTLAMINLNRYCLVASLGIIFVMVTGCGSTHPWDQYQIVKKTNTIEAYEDFIKRHPSSYSSETEDAKYRMALLRYKQNPLSRTAEGIEKFLQDNPNTFAKNTAQLDADSLRFDMAVKEDNLEGYSKFIHKAITSNYRAKADEKLKIFLRNDLIDAIRNDDRNKISLLLDKGANINWETDSGDSFFTLACSNYNLLEFLLKNNLAPNGTINTHVILNYNGKDITSDRALPLLDFLIFSNTYTEATSIQYIQLLLKNGADLNAKLRGGHSAISLALDKKKFTLFEYLMSCKPTNFSYFSFEYTSPSLNDYEKLRVRLNMKLNDYDLQEIEKGWGFYSMSEPSKGYNVYILKDNYSDSYISSTMYTNSKSLSNTGKDVLVLKNVEQFKGDVLLETEYKSADGYMHRLKARLNDPMLKKIYNTDSY